MYSQDLRKILLAPNLPERAYGVLRKCLYTLSNKNPSAWSPAQAVTWRIVAIKIRVVLFSPYLCIRGVSLSFILPLTLRWVEAESLYKTNAVIKVNSTENMWSGVKRTMQETWPVLPPRNSDGLCDIVSDAWDEVACLSVTFHHWLSPWVYEIWNFDGSKFWDHVTFIWVIWKTLP